MGDWIDSLHPVNQNVPFVWDQFLDEFNRAFSDSSKEQTARQELEGLRMAFPKIDEYMTKFKELARKANYTIGNNETIQLFLKGLPAGVLKDTMRAPVPVDYLAIKQQAVEATKSQQMVSHILEEATKGRRPGGR